MSALIGRSALRFYLRHPGQLVLALAGIALGVAVVVAVDLANGTALRAFELSRDLTSSRATHLVEAASGELPQTVYRQLKVDLGVDRVAPVVEGRIVLRGDDGERSAAGPASRPAAGPAAGNGRTKFQQAGEAVKPADAGVANVSADAGASAGAGTPGGASDANGGDELDGSVSLLGLDPLAELAFDDAPLAGRPAGDEPAPDLAALLTRPGVVLLPRALATRLGLAVDDTFAVAARGVTHELRVGGVFTPAAGVDSGSNGPLIADIATAQETLGRLGVLSRIEADLTALDARRIAAALPPGVTVVPIDASNDATSQMLSAFRVNLTALSLLALVVGMLLIYATMSFAVVQRRRSLGTLRALGATREQVARSVLLESIALGVAATAVGLLLGWALSRVLISLVLATINDLYFSTRVSPDVAPLWPYLKATVLGVGATALAALHPALEAASEPARDALRHIAFEQSMRRRFAAGPWLAVAAFVAGAVFIALPGDALLPAFAGLFCVLAGYALLVPTATAALLGALQRLTQRRFGLSVSLALRGAVASLSRTAIAVTALAVAVATVVGIGVMIDSFRGSVTQWLGDSLVADFYVVTRGAEGDGFSRGEVDTLRSLDGVAGISLSRTLTLATPAGEVPIRASAAGPIGYSETLVAGDPATAFDALAGGRAILLSEPFARRRQLEVDDTLTLPAPQGEIAFRVVGVFRDYRSRDSGALLPYDVVERIWGDLAPLGVGLYLAPGADAGALGDSLGRFAAQRGDTQLAANEEIRRITLEVFDRTFAITGVLRLLAGIIAFFGILSALLALQLERSREIATLRALGFTRGQAAANSLAQTTVLGAVAGVLALPLGLMLAALLIFVINQRSFGWSMGFVVAPEQLATGLLLALLAAFLAGVYPARRLAHLPVAANLRGE